MASSTWPVRALRALVVDGDEGAAQKVTAQLTRLGWQAQELKEGDSLGEALEREGHELVLLELPPGEQACAALLQKLRAADKHVCVIAMTASPSVELAVTAMRHSAFHVLRKPVDEAELERVITEAVRAKGLCVTLEQDLNSAIGKRVRERRTEESLTLREVSRATGLSVSLISQVELGKSAASIATLHKLAAALKVPMSHFVETL